MTINYSKQVLLKRGNTTVSSTYIGPVGEITLDTDLLQLRVHDGETAGGWIVPSGQDFDNIQSNLAIIANVDLGLLANVSTLLANANSQQTQIDSLLSSVADIVTLGNTAPGTANETFWFNETDGRLYIKQGNVWTDSSPTILPTPGYIFSTLENIAGNIIPDANNTYSLGSPTAQWKDVWVSNATIYFDSVPMSVDGSGNLTFNGNPLVSYVDGNLSVGGAVVDGGNLGNLEVLEDTVLGSTSGNTYIAFAANGISNNIEIGTNQPGNISLYNGTDRWTFGANGVLTIGANATISNTDEFRLWATDTDITVYRNGQDGYGVKAGNIEVYTDNALRTVVNSNGLEIVTGGISFGSSTAIIANVDVITVLDHVRSPAYQFANGVSILSNLIGSSSDGNVNIQTTSGVPVGSVTKISDNQGWGGGSVGTNLPTTGGTGTGLTVDVVDSGSAYAGISINTPGSGYTDGDIITVTNGGMSDTFSISVPVYDWQFGNNGTTTFPSNLTIQSNPFNPGTVISQANALISIATTGNNAATYIGWSEFEYEPGNIALVAFNDTTGAVAIQTGATTGPEAFIEWIFDADGTLTFPTGGNLIFDSSATSVIDGVTNITANGNVTAAQYNFANGVNIFDTITGVTSISTSVSTLTVSDASGDYTYGALSYDYAVNGTSNSFSIEYSAPLAFGNVDINVGNVTATGTANVANLIISGSAPGSLLGSAGDTAGMIRIDSNYIYYCTSAFVSSSWTVGWGGATSNTLFLTQGDYPTPQVGWIVDQGGNGPWTIDTISDSGYGSWQITWVGIPYGSPTGGTATLTNPNPSTIWTQTPLAATTYANTNVAAYIDHGITINNGAINFTASPPAYSSPGIQWPYGIYQTEYYGNTQVGAYLKTYGGNIATGNITTGNITFSDATVQTTAYVAANTVSKVTGTWSVTTGTNNYSFTVPVNGAYHLWVRGNIPSGILTYLATVHVTNDNVAVLGTQRAWNYTGDGSPLILTSMPSQIVGAEGTISTASVVGTTNNTFVFGISNTSGGTVTVSYGYTKIS